MSKLSNSTYLRSLIFGFEDSIVSTVGLLSGVALTGVGTKIVLLTGTILIFVEAFSMGAGMYLSESSVEEFEDHKYTDNKISIKAGIITFISYCLAGFIILLPYIFLNTITAFYISIVISFISLACLGILSAKISKIPVFKKVTNMVLVGGIAIIIGIFVGSLVDKLA